MDIVFKPALTKVRYARNDQKHEKRYSGTFQIGRLMKLTRKSFKRAWDADTYAKSVMARYRRLLIAKEQAQA